MQLIIRSCFVITVLALMNTPSSGAGTDYLQYFMPILRQSLTERLTKQEEDAPRGFLGLALKWRLGIPISTFDDYTALLQFAYPIGIPYSIYKDGIKSRSDEGGEYDEPQEIRYRREVRDERHNFFKGLEPMLERLSLPPRHCLLRTVCEISVSPFEESFLGDAINAVLKPSSVGRTESSEEDHSFNDYVEAEEHGSLYGNCERYHGNCSVSVLDVLFPSNQYP